MAKGPAIGQFSIQGIVTLQGVKEAQAGINQLAKTEGSLRSLSSRRTTQGLLELSRAAEDAAVVFSTQGLSGAVRASVNNIAQIGNILNPVTGIIAGFSGAILTFALPALVRLFEGTDRVAENMDGMREAMGDNIDAIQRMGKLKLDLPGQFGLGDADKLSARIRELQRAADIAREQATLLRGEQVSGQQRFFSGLGRDERQRLAAQGLESRGLFAQSAEIALMSDEQVKDLLNTLSFNKEAIEAILGEERATQFQQYVDQADAAIKAAEANRKAAQETARALQNLEPIFDRLVAPGETKNRVLDEKQFETRIAEGSSESLRAMQDQLVAESAALDAEMKALQENAFTLRVALQTLEKGSAEYLKAQAKLTENLEAMNATQKEQDQNRKRSDAVREGLIRADQEAAARIQAQIIGQLGGLPADMEQIRMEFEQRIKDIEKLETLTPEQRETLKGQADALRRQQEARAKGQARREEISDEIDGLEEQKKDLEKRLRGSQNNNAGAFEANTTGAFSAIIAAANAAKADPIEKELLAVNKRIEALQKEANRIAKENRTTVLPSLL